MFTAYCSVVLLLLSFGCCAPIYLINSEYAFWVFPFSVNARVFSKSPQLMSAFMLLPNKLIISLFRIKKPSVFIFSDIWLWSCPASIFSSKAPRMSELNNIFFLRKKSIISFRLEIGSCAILLRRICLSWTKIVLTLLPVFSLFLGLTKRASTMKFPLSCHISHWRLLWRLLSQTYPAHQLCLKRVAG